MLCYSCCSLPLRYERLAYSYAFGQSVKLDLFEWSIDRTIQGTRNIPENLARTGKIGIGIREVTKKVGTIIGKW